MFETLDQVLRDRCKLTREQLILVGVSGGSDSLCLMDNLRRLGYSIAVAHFDHQLRSESSQEAISLRNELASTGIPFYLGVQDVMSYAKTHHLSIEAAARACRYQFLFGIARQLSAQAVAVGHTADDQVETVLMHLIRGTGLSGLKGMAYRTVLRQFDRQIPVVRPLLGSWRVDTQAYCLDHDLKPHVDRSNDSLVFLRNRVRIQLIPSLETYNPRIREAIRRMADTLREDEFALIEVLGQAWRSCVSSETDDLIVFDSSQLASQPPGIVRNLVRRAAQVFYPDIDLSFDTLDRAREFISCNKELTQRVTSDNYQSLILLHGLILVREAGAIFIVRDLSSLPTRQWPQLLPDEKSLAVSLPGETFLTNDWIFSAEFRGLDKATYDQAIRSQDQYMAWLEADNLPSGLELRTRRQSDRIRPLGMKSGSLKLSDLMVNEKLPARARAGWPLLCSGDNLIWIPGYRIADPYKITPSTTRIAFFRLWNSSGG